MTGEQGLGRAALSGRFVLLGVSGGIAAYKAIEVCRQLVDAGAHVAPVLTESALRFVGATTFSALGSEPAQTSLFGGADPIPHTRLGQAADLVIVAPATARFLAGYATGLADDLLGTALLATTAPVLVCPAMHTEMWWHPSVRDNLEVLVRRGVEVVEPEPGRLAGGDIGEGRLAEPWRIVDAAAALLARGQDLAGRSVLVSAGGTREPIDPVRYLSNRSSGKQGYAIARQAARRGARVTLVSCADLPEPAGVEVLAVETAQQLHDAMLERADAADVVVMAAAVADFRPKVAAEEKLKRTAGLPEIVLEPTPDVLAALVKRRSEHGSRSQVIVAFAAETTDPEANARRKLEHKQVDLVVLNDVSAEGVGFGHDTNAVTIFGANGSVTSVPLSHKTVVADAVLDAVRSLVPGDSDQPD